MVVRKWRNELSHTAIKWCSLEKSSEISWKVKYKETHHMNQNSLYKNLREIKICVYTKINLQMFSALLIRTPTGHNPKQSEA